MKKELDVLSGGLEAPGVGKSFHATLFPFSPQRTRVKAEYRELDPYASKSTDQDPDSKNGDLQYRNKMHNIRCEVGTVPVVPGSVRLTRCKHCLKNSVSKKIIQKTKFIDLLNKHTVSSLYCPNDLFNRFAFLGIDHETLLREFHFLVQHCIFAVL
jgi:hypothetical protein